jgi:PAS domain S-box-containing protein
VAGSKDGTLRPQDGDQLRQRLRELETEAESLRAALGEASRPARPSDASAHKDFGQPRSLANQYKQIAEILDASADAIISVDDRGLVRRFNRGAEAVFGYPSSEVIGRPLDILIPKRFRKSHRSHLAAFGRANESSRLMNERGEIFGLHRDGAEFPAEASIVRLEADGRPVFTVIMRDITERKAAEAALREREAQLRQAQEMARIGTFVWDETTDSFEYCSDELAALLGSTPEAIMKASKSDNWVLERIHPDDRDRYTSLVTKALETAVPYDVEFQFLHGDGHLIHIREMGEPELDADGRVVRTFGTEQDITHIRQAEEFLRQSESRLRQAQRLARLGTYVWDDVADVCVYCSEELAALFGLTPAQFVAQRGTEEGYLAHLHPDDRERILAVTGKALENAAPYEIEYRAYDANGEIRHIHEMAEPIAHDNGRQIRTFGTMQDITGLRQVQEALKKSESQLRQAQRMARVGAYVWDDARGLCLECSEELANLFGMTVAEFLETRGTHEKMRAHIHPDDLEANVLAEQKATRTLKPYDTEFRAWDKVGNLLYFRETGEPLTDADGMHLRTFCTLQDITDIRLTEQALRQSEEQFRNLIEGSIQGVLIHRDFKPIFANQAFAEIFGYDSPDEVLALGSFVPLVADEERQRLESFKQARKENEDAPERYEFAGLRKDGSTIWLENRVNVVKWGGESATLSVTVDITERRQAEIALRRTMRSGDLLRQIATAANSAASAEEAMAICLKAICQHGGWDIAGVFVLADDKSGDMAPAGLWWADNPQDFTAFRRTSKSIRFAPGKGLPGRVFKSGKPAWIPDVRKDRNFPRAKIAGDIEVTSGFAFPVLVGQKIVAVLEFFSRELRERDDDLVDVATQAGTILGRAIDRQRAERALRDSEEQIRLMTDNIPVLISYIDQNKTFGFVNKTTEAWYARPASELVGASLRKLIGKAGFTKMKARIDTAMTGETVRFEEVLAYPDGVTRHIDATYVPHFGAQGNVRGIFTMVVDISARIKTEEQLRHAQRMEAVGKLTGGVAHDFNNLLAVIMGNSEIVRDKLGEADPAVKAIMHAALRGAELTQRLLAFSRQQALRPEAADLAGLTREMASILSRTLGETIAIEVNSSRKPWPAKVDAGELENAILNLAINARDAMPDGGTLTIKTENVTLSAKKAAQFDNAQPGQYVRLSLKDTGEGMPPEVLNHAFEPFYTTKAFGEGSGLGLSMVYGFATQSGGFATIDSRKGKGATVSLYLPRAEASDMPSRDCRPLCQPAEQGGSIMVVEDDPDVRRLTVTLLAAMGYTVLEAEDGETAMLLIHSDRHIDLLLSDVVLPGDMSGPAVAEAAVANRPDLRVMFMSGYAEDVIRRDREGVETTVDADLLTKPFTRAQLAQKIKAAMETDEN